MFLFTDIEGAPNYEIEFFWNDKRTAHTTWGRPHLPCYIYDALPELCPMQGPFAECQLGDANGVLSDLSIAERDEILAWAMARPSPHAGVLGLQFRIRANHIPASACLTW